MPLGRLGRLVAGMLLVLALGAGFAHAQSVSPQGAAALEREGHATHRVEPGDTLMSIGARYLRQPAQWRQLQRPNGIADPAQLVPGSTVRIPARLLKPSALAARAEFVRGADVLSQPATHPASARAPRAGRAAAAVPTPTPVVAGASLVAGTRIQVPEDGYLRLRLADGSIVRVLAGSDVELKRLRRRHGSFESIVDVKRGKVESEVTKQPKGRVFEIHAPGTVASVRGTQFDVSVGPDGRVAAAVTEGEVALQARSGARRAGVRTARVSAGQGAVVGPGGELGAQRPLLPAPDLAGLSVTFEDAARMRLDFGPSSSGDYEVRLAHDAAFADVLRNGVARGGRLQFDMPDDGVYLLGVRAIDADGLAGAEAQRSVRIHARPVPPLYQYPGPGGRVTAEDGQLVCSEVVGADAVHIQVASRADFSSPEIDAPGLARCRIGLGSLPPGDYHWRVAAVRTANGAPVQGPFAPPQRFSIVPEPTIGTFTVVDAGEDPTLYWAAAPGQRFRGQAATDPAFLHTVLEADLAQPRWTWTGLPRGVYFVRLRVVEADGLTGPWAPARRVHVGGTVQSGSGGGIVTSDGEPVVRP